MKIGKINMNGSERNKGDLINRQGQLKYPKDVTKEEIDKADYYEELELREIFKKADLPIYADGYWEPYVRLSEKEENLIFRKDGERQIYLINTNDFNKEHIWTIILEILATRFFDYTCIESVCEKGIFSPEIFKSKVEKDEMRALNEKEE